jgi:hypothetical protein
MAYDRDCIVEFGVPAEALLATGPRAVLEVADDSVTWRLEIPQAFAPRSFELVTPVDEIARRGERVTVRWSPSTDRIDRNAVAFELYRADAAPGTGAVIREIDVVDDTLSFTLPPRTGAAAWSGPALLRVLGTFGIKPAISACPVHRCSVHVAFTVSPVPFPMAPVHAAR